MQANITFINEKQLNLKAANQSQRPDVYALPLTAPILADDIATSLLREMKARNNALASCGLDANQILAANIRAFGRMFLATLSTVPIKEQARLIEEFDVLTMEFLK